MPASVPMQFVCDACDEIIPSAKVGLVEWLTDVDGKHYGFRIIHERHDGESCRAYHSRPEGSLIRLERLAGTDGLAHALSLLHPGALYEVNPDSCGVQNVAEYANFLRRLFLPHFDKARLFFDLEKARGLHLDLGETDFYNEGNLQRILARHRQ